MQIPSPVELITLATTIGAGLGACLGIAFGTARVLYLKRVTPARIEADKAWDESHRETTIGKLELALETNARYEKQIKEGVERIDRLERYLMILREDLETERERSRLHSEE